MLRLATAQDQSVSRHRVREQDALAICATKVSKHNPPMKLLDAEYTLDRAASSSSSPRPRRLPRTGQRPASALRTRIELHQVGARDAAKILGGFGRCGRQLLLRRLAARLPAGLHAHGERPGPGAQPHQVLGAVRQADVLSALRGGVIREAAGSCRKPARRSTRPTARPGCLTNVPGKRCGWNTRRAVCRPRSCPRDRRLLPPRGRAAHARVTAGTETSRNVSLAGHPVPVFSLLWNHQWSEG